jgi:hypothetical protein
VAEGWGEGGPLGGLVAAITFAINDRASEALAGEPDDVAEDAAKALEQEDKTGPNINPITKRDLIQLGVEQGSDLTFEGLTYATEKVGEQIEPMLEEFFAGHTGYPSGLPVVTGEIKQWEAVEEALSKLVTIWNKQDKEVTSWRQWINGKGALPAKITANIAGDLAAASINNWFRSNEADAWGKFVAAARANEAAVEAAAQASTLYFDVEDTYGKLLGAEQRLLAGQNPNVNKFVVDVSEPFPRGATVVVHVVRPPGSNFRFSNGTLGSEPMKVSEEMTVVADALEHRGEHPGLVTLDVAGAHR